MKYINNNRTFSVALLLMVIAFCNCSKDKGTYDIQPINRVDIGLDSFYYVNKGEHLMIQPKISYSKDVSADTLNYIYEWSFEDATRTLLLSKNRDLDFSDKIVKPNTINTGIYKLYYRITDKKTGVFYDKKFKIKIGTLIYEGWLALCEMQNGSSRLDMVSNGTGTDIVYQNVIQKVGSDYTLTGKPRFITYVGNYYLDFNATGLSLKDGICVGTSDNVVFLDKDSLKFYPPTIYSGGNDLASRFNPFGLTPPSTWTDVSSDDQSIDTYTLFANNSLYRIANNNPSSVLNKIGNTPFIPSPWTAIGEDPATATAQIILFNQDTKSFLMCKQPDFSPQDIPAGKLFNYHTGMNLQYMDFVSYQGGLVFAILKDNGSGKRYLAKFTTAGKQIAYEELAVEGLSEESQFAVSPVQGYLMYTVGNKIYEYDPLLKQSFLMHDYGDRKISVFKFQKFKNNVANINSYKPLSNKLIVATYSPGNLSSSGNIDLFTVPDVNGQLQTYKSYAGLGKVVSLTYMQQ